MYSGEFGVDLEIPRNSMNKKDRRNRKVIIVYEFLKEREIKNAKFSKKDIEKITGWSSSTVNTYFSKKWNHFLRKDQGRFYRSNGIKAMTESDFINLHSQTIKRKEIVGKNYDYLYKAKIFALTAVTIYNNPCLECRAYSYVANMMIAWTSLFHALFEKNGIQPITSKKGKEHTWSLKTCINNYKFWKGDDEKFIKANLFLLIEIRNMVEHNILSVLPDKISMYSQACLINFEKLFQLNLIIL